MLGLYLKILSVLNRASGPTWPFLILASLIRGRAVVKKTRWGGSDSYSESAEEERYVKRLAIVSAMYLSITEKKGKEQAFELMRDILVSAGRIVVRRRFHTVDLTGMAGMERLMKFNDYMKDQEEERHNKREYIVKDGKTCHYLIKRCLVSEFFKEAGTPELTKFVCEVDNYFFPRAFADFNFSRGDSMENTIAYGRPHCDFILKLKYKTSR